MVMGSELVVTSQEKYHEVRKVTVIQLLAGCLLTIKRIKSKSIEDIEQKTLCHYMKPLNDPMSEVMFMILSSPLEKDTDNCGMLRGGR